VKSSIQQTEPVFRAGGGIWTVLVALWFLGSYAIAALNPVYFDEIGYEYILGRYFREGGRMLFMWPQCTTEFSQETPLLWIVPRMILGALYGVIPNLVWLRGLGLAIALLDVWLLFKILTNNARLVPRGLIATYSLSMSLGAFPFLFVMARPEGALVMCAFLAIVIAQYGMQSSDISPWRRGVLLAAVGFLASFAAALHPLGVIMTPIFLACFVFIRCSRKIVISAMILLCIANCVSISSHTGVTRCDESQEITDFISWYSGSPGLHGAYLLLLSAPQSFAFLLHHLFALGVQRGPFYYGILPRLRDEQSDLALYIAGAIIILFVVLFSWLSVRAVGLWVRGGFRNVGEARFSSILSLALGITLLGVVISQPNPFIYRLSFVIPITYLLVGFLLFPAYYRCQALFCERAVRGLATLSLAGFVVVVVTYAPTLLAQMGSVVVPRQENSTNQLAKMNNNDLQLAMRECGIVNAAASRRVVVDEHTYWHVRNSSEPVIYQFNNIERDPLSRRLVEIGASALLVHCDGAVPPLLSVPLRRVGEVCCLRRSDIEEFTPISPANPAL
jgi:hypothetical protein